MCLFVLAWAGLEDKEQSDITTQNIQPEEDFEAIVSEENFSKSDEITESNGNPYECKICKKRFKLQGTLKAHERIHTGETPYQCDTFQKSFKQKSNLNIHKMIHLMK